MLSQRCSTCPLPLSGGEWGVVRWVAGVGALHRNKSTPSLRLSKAPLCRDWQGSHSSERFRETKKKKQNKKKEKKKRRGGTMGGT